MAFHQSIIEGHKSIVNTALFHPYLPQIVTAGVERHITLHSPTPTAPNVNRLERTDEYVRQLPESNPENELRFLHLLMNPRQVSNSIPDPEFEEMRTITFFDGCVYILSMRFENTYVC